MNTQAPKNARASKRQKKGQSQAPRDHWMWKDVNNREAIRTIDHATLRPAETAVSSSLGCELLCSYSWQTSKKPTIQVPGTAPTWQDLPLPVTVPPDKGFTFVDQNAERMPEYPFEPLFRAVVSMKPQFQFDKVDVVINRNSLRRLLDFCKGVSLESFRVNLFMIHNTLIVERSEKNGRHFINTPGAGFGKNFEKTFTKFSSDDQKSTGHHRVLSYPLGHLNCVVRFEVDARYDKEDDEAGLQTEDNNQDIEDEGGVSLVGWMDDLSLGSSGPKSSSASRATTPRAPNNGSSSSLRLISAQLSTIMPQSTAAELKTTTRFKSLGQCIPQLWFGRTPWLIVAHHKAGTFDGVNITHVKPDDFIAWETRLQEPLQKMVTLISQLKEAIIEHRGKPCVATFDQTLSPRCIKVYASSLVEKQALSNDLIDQCWATPR
ncbi:hypothetical protein TWF694_002117 [Orbilia ellipsospora]|uniref:Geranylgeranyl pyrophosphate synthetase n=1 Tax=Orbilia ellipsospora TaxID=2528407 RepID=A0AAV9X7H0_9PEZI